MLIDKFFDNATEFLKANPSLSMRDKQNLLGASLKRNSLKHALIVFNLMEKPTIEHKNMLMSLISGSEQNNTTYSEIVASLLVGERDEGLYTLVIRYYCRWNQYEKAKNLLNEMIIVGIRQHNRTFVPLLNSCPSIAEAEDLMNILELYATQPPSLEIYEIFLDKIINWNISPQKFLAEINIYSKFYSFLTPKTVSIFNRAPPTIIKQLKNLVIQQDGLILQVPTVDAAGTDTKVVYTMPLGRLERVETSYEMQWRWAKIIYDKHPEGFSEFENRMQSKEITWDIVLDGANIALQNNSATFREDWIILIAEWALSRNMKVLIILSISRRDISRKLQAYIYKNKNLNLYYAPSNHNDDLFWIYAALSRGTKFVTNDEMRDHTWDLLGNDSKIRFWKESSRITFSIVRERLTIKEPTRYSRTIQLMGRNCLHCPVFDGEAQEYLGNLDRISGWVSYQIQIPE